MTHITSLSLNANNTEHEFVSAVWFMSYNIICYKIIVNLLDAFPVSDAPNQLKSPGGRRTDQI